jgi:hypothetical protein
MTAGTTITTSDTGSVSASKRPHRRTLLATLFALVAVAAAVAAVPAAKADNILYPGGYDPGNLFCQPGISQIDVWAPKMNAQASGETVAFLDQLLRWNGSSWVVYRQTAGAYQTQYSDIFTSATDPNLQRWISGSTVWDGEWYFGNLPHGYYAVQQVLRWGGAGGYAPKNLTTYARIGWTTTTVCQI